ncbi:MAG: PEP-CTERM sorting domain-containing protein [Gammaproteobacteria bacterium]|nr:PEP-CTERM sorting domain-containing protein [Gammaproteobacteria bacterium]
MYIGLDSRHTEQLQGIYARLNNEEQLKVVEIWGVRRSVPEPGTLGLIGLGLAGIGLGLRRRKS